MTERTRTGAGVQHNLVRVLLSIALLGLLAGCDMSERNRIQAELAERERIEAARRAAEAMRHDASAERDEPEAAEHELADAAARSFRVFLDRIMGDPSVEPRKYATALEQISVQGDTLYLSLSLLDKDEAKKLCNVALLGWTERAKHEVSSVQVTNVDSGVILARSTRTSTGADVCE